MTDFDARRIAHLEMIHRAIDRMAEKSARMKSYALVATAAVLSTAAATETHTLALVAVVLIVTIWALDARYLAQERWFRELYELARTAKGETDFVMMPSEAIRLRHGPMQTLASWSTAPLYGVLVLLSLIVSVV